MAGIDKNRDQILETAEMLLRRFGPEKLRIVDVARALTMSHSNIYRYYPDKAAILDQIAERWLSRISEPLEAIVSEPGTAASRLEKWLVTLINLKRRKVNDDPELFRTYQAIAEQSRVVVELHLDRLITQLTEIIQTGTASGEWTVRNPRKAAIAILNATAVFHHPVFVARPGPPPAIDEVHTTLRLLIAGLKSGAL